MLFLFCVVPCHVYINDIYHHSYFNMQHAQGVAEKAVQHTPNVAEKAVQHTANVAEKAVQHIQSIPVKAVMGSKMTSMQKLLV